MKSDTQWIQESLSGDPEAFGALVQKYQNRLYQTLLPIAGSPENALDLVQEALVRSYTQLHSFRQESSFFTWLYRIAIRLAYDFLEKNRRRGPTYHFQEPRNDGQRSELGIPEPIQRGEDPSETILRDDTVKAVRGAMDRLPPELRVVLVMREMDGQCYETIAEILELPLGTVRSRLHRARLQLKDELERVLMNDDE